MTPNQNSKKKKLKNDKTTIYIKWNIPNERWVIRKTTWTFMIKINET